MVLINCDDGYNDDESLCYSRIKKIDTASRNTNTVISLPAVAPATHRKNIMIHETHSKRNKKS